MWDLIDLGTAVGSYIHVLGTAMGGLALFVLSFGMNPTVAIGTVQANHVQGNSKSG